MQITIIRQRALGHQWSVSKAVGVCQVAGLLNFSKGHAGLRAGVTRDDSLDFFRAFFHACFGTVQKSLFAALDTILAHFLFDLASFLGAPGPLNNSPKCCKGHHF